MLVKDGKLTKEGMKFDNVQIEVAKFMKVK